MPRITRPKPGEPIRLVIMKTGEPRYRAVVDTSRHPRKQSTRTFATLAEARAWVDSVRDQVRRGEFVRSSPVTLAEVVDRWLASRVDVRAVTVTGHRTALRPVVARIGSRRAQDVTPEDIAALVRWLSSNGSSRTGGGLSHRSVVYALASLKQALSYAVRVGVLRSNPAAEIRPPRKRRGDTREALTWTPAQLRSFVAAGDRDEWANVWRLVATGMRRSEVLGLRWSEVDRETGTVTVVQGRVRVGAGRTVVDDPKSAASWRPVPVEDMHRGSRAILQAAWLASPDKSGLIVRDAHGRPATVDAFRAGFRRVCLAAGVPVIRPHQIRHTLALIMHRQGVAPVDAAALLGHSVQVHLSTYLPRDAAGVGNATAGLRAALDAVAEA